MRNTRGPIVEGLQGPLFHDAEVIMDPVPRKAMLVTTFRHFSAWAKASD
jgi:hypothetical protein